MNWESEAAKAAAIEQSAAAQNINNPSTAAFAISATIGTSKSSFDSTQSSTTQQGTTLQSRDIQIRATEGDITATGAKLQATGQIALDAAGQINLQAARNSTELQQQNQSSSASIGVTFGLGQQNGLSFQAGASKAQGEAQGSQTTYDNTLINAGGVLSIKSGGDTTLAGAQVVGGTVQADIGGQLTIRTLQDQSQYSSEQQSFGWGVSLCIPPLCYGTSSASISAAQQQIDHSYQSATGQSGIAAGQGGFQLNVAGQTALIGGAITSQAEAGKNMLTTAGLTYTDLANTQDTRASSASISVGTSASVLQNATGNLLGNLAGRTGLPESGSQSGVTQSVISPSSITITSGDAQSNANAATLTSRNSNTANGSLVNTMTLEQAQKLQHDIQTAQANAYAAQLVGEVMNRSIGDIAQQSGWAEGSAQKTILHGLSGAVQAAIGNGSLAAGAISGALNEQLVPVMEAYLVSQGYVKGTAAYNELMQAGSALAGAAAGVVIAGTQGAATGGVVAFSGTTNNYLKHAEIDRLLAAQANCAKGDSAACAEQKSLQALSAQRDAQLQACVGQTSSYCTGLQQEVRNAYAEILRNSTNSPDMARTLEVWHTKSMADSTLSDTSRAAGVATGLVQTTADAVIGLAQGIATFTRAALGDETARDRVGATVDSLVRLSDPSTLAQVISTATTAQRERLAAAYEAGDAFAIGRVGGEILATLPVMPAGTIKTVGGAVKTADQVAIEIASTRGTIIKGTGHVASEVPPSSPLVSGGGLQSHEAAGGHLVARHVGLSDADLAQRLATTNISSASTFVNRATAEAAVSATLDANATAITTYLKSNSQGYLAIELTTPTTVGFKLVRGASEPVSATNVRVVITRDAAMPTGFRIVTGYPF